MENSSLLNTNMIFDNHLIKAVEESFDNGEIYVCI